MMRELQRRGEFDTLVLLAPDAHNRQQKGRIRHLRSYAAYLARKIRLVLTSLLDPTTPVPSPDWEAPGQTSGPEQRETKPNTSTPGHNRRAQEPKGFRHATSRGNSRRLAGEEFTGNPPWPPHESEPLAESDSADDASIPRQPMQPHQPQRFSFRRDHSQHSRPGVVRGGGLSGQQAAVAKERERAWLLPLRDIRCVSVDLFWLGKGHGGLAVRLLSALGEDLWGQETVADEEGEVWLLHQLLGDLLYKSVRLRSVAIVGALNAGLGGRAHGQQNRGIERILGSWAPTLARLSPNWVFHKLLGAGFVQETLHGDRDRLLCTLAHQEKRSYGLTRRAGSLLALADNVLFYGQLNEHRRVSTASVLGIWEPMLLSSVGVAELASHKEHHNHYRYIDVTKTPTNRQRPGSGYSQEPLKVVNSPEDNPPASAWRDDDTPEVGTETSRLEKRLLLFDRNICKVMPRRMLYEATLKLLEIVNKQQEPDPLAPLRFTRYTDYNSMYVNGNEIRQRGFLFFGKKRRNFTMAKWGFMHAAVRMLQSRAVIKATDFDHDKSIPAEDWFKSGGGRNLS